VTAKRILAEALERVLREHNLKVEYLEVLWAGPIQGAVSEHRYQVRGLEVKAYLKEPE